MTINYYRDNQLCSRIYVDESEKRVSVENFVDNPMFRAFGINEKPTWKDFEDFLEERCFPRNINHVELNLRSLGLTEYEPLEICKRTNGRMAGDSMWMSFE